MYRTSILSFAVLLLGLAQFPQAQVPAFSALEDKLIDLGSVGQGNKDFSGFAGLDSILDGVEIVMLGEQSHGEATTYETKVKLVQYLHQEMGFDLLLFESGLYDCQKAWESIKKGESVKRALANSIFSLWAGIKEFAPLPAYVQTQLGTDRELMVLGFDSQFTGAFSKKHFLSDLKEYLFTIDPALPESGEWDHFSTTIEFLLNFDKKALKQQAPASDTLYINHLVDQIEKANAAGDEGYWVQVLHSAKVYLGDFAFGTNLRDRQMAENLIWLREQHPTKKIICWGATSHFLFNSSAVRMRSPIISMMGGNYYRKHKMMGDYVKEKYDSQLYTIGFVAYQGKFGLNRHRQIKPGKEGTLEGMLGESEYDNLFLPLGESVNVKGFHSRPLGNFYMKNDIDQVMDGVVFNRLMRPLSMDYKLLRELYPKNEYFQRMAGEE